MKILEVVGKPFIFHGYHGTFARDLPDVLTTRQFGGLHVGTEQAARDRLEHTRASRRMGRPGGENIIPVTVRLNRPFGPVSETELSFILNLPQGTQELPSLAELKAQGYDGIIYKNIVEDPGSTSVMAFDRNSVMKGHQ
jgi:hypothetical protein